MTAFVLVPGLFTGAHVWEDTADRLAAAGAEVRAVALTGTTDASVGAAVDLERHIADVIEAIDSIAGRCEIVLVGHDYGVHPALGAADRRVDRIARIVYLDAGMPQDGVPALAAFPDPSLRAELAETGFTAAELAAPTRDEWPRWGSTQGVPDAALDRLTARAVPQPLGTLLQPLRLTGAVAAVPTTGVLCTGNGVSIEMVQLLVGFGDPAIQALTDPAVSFFELPTGHWPMLSCPAELTDVLLRAAAGEGHRLTPVDPAEQPPHMRPFLLDVPEVPRERTGHVDLYLPHDLKLSGNSQLPDDPAGADGPRPAVVFVHGGPVPADVRPTPRDWTTYQGYARLAAAEGAVGVMLDHRLHDVTDHPKAAEDIAAAVELVRADPRVDADRVALWFFSGSGPITAEWLAAPLPWLRCLAATYPILEPLPNWGLSGSRFHPVRAVEAAGDLPVVITRVGLESPEIAATVEKFLVAAEHCGAHVEVIDVPNGHHGFENTDRTDESREAVRRAMRAVLGHLTDPGRCRIRGT